MKNPENPANRSCISVLVKHGSMSESLSNIFYNELLDENGGDFFQDGSLVFL